MLTGNNKYALENPLGRYPNVFKKCHIDHDRLHGSLSCKSLKYLAISDGRSFSTESSAEVRSSLDLRGSEPEATTQVTIERTNSSVVKLDQTGQAGI